jgi:hypothetical protein
MHKSATKCNETLSKWCKNKHGASKIIDTFWTYQNPTKSDKRQLWKIVEEAVGKSRDIASRSSGQIKGYRQQKQRRLQERTPIMHDHHISSRRRK